MLNCTNNREVLAIIFLGFCVIFAMNIGFIRETNRKTINQRPVYTKKDKLKNYATLLLYSTVMILLLQAICTPKLCKKTETLTGTIIDLTVEDNNIQTDTKGTLILETEDEIRLVTDAPYKNLIKYKNKKITINVHQNQKQETHFVKLLPDKK